MEQCDQGNSASLYALGLLDEPESSTFERHLSLCSSCAAEVRQSGDLAVELAGMIPALAPPAGLRQRVLTEAVLPRGIVALVRGGKLNWRPTPFPGVTAARLYKDSTSGEVASLVRMIPGAHYPSHRHASLEHCYVLEGDLVFEDYSMEAGDYSAGRPNQEHTAATTKQGCLVFIVHNAHDEMHVN